MPHVREAQDDWDATWAAFDARKRGERIIHKKRATPAAPARHRLSAPLAFLFGALTSGLLMTAFSDVMPARGAAPAGAEAVGMSRRELADTARSLAALAAVSPRAARWAAELQPAVMSPRAVAELQKMAQPAWRRVLDGVL